MDELRQLEKLIELFNQGLGRCYRTILVERDDEPLYVPESFCGCAQIGFMRGNLNSALHELAHWCIAGWRRRQLEDYGYWYLPDGRTPTQQAEFERVEARPQALEWCFQEVLGRPFEPSFDNLRCPSDSQARQRFMLKILFEKQQMQQHDRLPYRAQRLMPVLANL